MARLDPDIVARFDYFGRKYTDQDVRDDEELLYDAIAHAQAYTGDWQVMADARTIALETGTLPVPVARTVLNCVRADPHAHVHGTAPLQRTARPPHQPKPALRLVEPEPVRRVYWTESVARVKWTVGIPRWHTDNVRIHRVDPANCWCDWRRPHFGHAHQTQDFTRWEGTLVVHWLCGKRPTGALLFPTVEAVDQVRSGLIECRGCQEAGD